MNDPCPQCGEPLGDPPAAGGLCPKCLLKLGMERPGSGDAAASEARTRNGFPERGPERPEKTRSGHFVRERRR